MARNERVMVTITDDLTGKEQPEGQGATIPFMYEGKAYEIDLSDENVKKYHDMMAPYVEHARKVRNSPAARPAGGQRKRGGGESTPKEELDAIRAWARKNGNTVADTGVIPKSIKEAYANRDTVPMIPDSQATPKANNAPKPGPPAAPSQKPADDKAKQPATAGK